jgi:hypothetical protein
LGIGQDPGYLRQKAYNENQHQEHGKDYRSAVARDKIWFLMCAGLRNQRMPLLMDDKIFKDNSPHRHSS